VGAFPFVLLTPGSSPVVAGIGSAVLGLGMGLLSTAALVMVQELVDWAQRGSATAANLFARNLGSTLGAAVLGAILNYGLAHVPGMAPITADALRQLLQTGALAGGAEADGIRTALQHALNLTFWGVFLTALASFAIGMLTPPVPLRRSPQSIKAVLAEETAL
jgi:VIT1/CCC1 family predicted Fe2+/Mn2+ transporter